MALDHAYVDEASLQEMYWAQELSQRDIAKILGVARATVRYYMEKRGIPSRQQHSKRTKTKQSIANKGRLP